MTKTIAVRSANDGPSLGEILLEVLHKHGTAEDHIMQGFGNLRFAAAGYRTGFVAEKAFADGADEAPFAVVLAFAHLHLVATGQHVDFTRLNLQFARGTIGIAPDDLLSLQFESGAFGDVKNIRIIPVTRIAAFLQLHKRLAITLNVFGEGRILVRQNPLRMKCPA